MNESALILAPFFGFGKRVRVCNFQVNKLRAFAKKKRGPFGSTPRQKQAYGTKALNLDGTNAIHALRA